MVAIVDDDDLMRSALQGLLKSAGLPAKAFASAEEFLKSGQQHQAGCLVADIRMPGMSGLELQAKLNADHCRIPTIFMVKNWYKRSPQNFKFTAKFPKIITHDKRLKAGQTIGYDYFD